MELMMKNGDYVPDGVGGLRRASGDEELLCRVLYKLSVRRGSFPFYPALGSELYKLGREKKSERELSARQYITTALADENVSVEDVRVTEGEGGTLDVSLTLAHDGRTSALTVTVGGIGS